MLALLAFWCMATVHCTLEKVPGFGFLACCHHPDKAPHQDNDCDEDSCAVVESGFYQIEEQPSSAAEPVLLLSCLIGPLEPISAVTRQCTDTCIAAAPPGLPRIWQFRLRAALPPRAPSLLA